MKISYNWLKEFIDIDLDANKLGERLTLSGLELDGMHAFKDDSILDIEVTSNRGDCLSHLGVAREISAFSDRPFKFPNQLNSKPELVEDGFVKIENPEICPRFTARLIKNVKIGESPEWLQRRLESIGERSINNVADITNLVMHELGQPMHAFDLAKLKDQRLIVRLARDGEKIKTLDEIERKLDSSMLVICDSKKPVAIGGVMGGIDSGINEETIDVLLEVAYFDRESIRKTSRKLGLASEASYHFERGVDINNLETASNRATELIVELAGGTAADFIEVYPNQYQPIWVESTDLAGEINRLSGLEISDSEIIAILTRLGFESDSKSKWRVPSWRHDVVIDEDLVEEVLRVYGYDKIDEYLPTAHSSGEYQPAEMRKRKLRQTLTNLGFDEALSYSFIDQSYDDIFESIPSVAKTKGMETLITIKDPIIEGANRMRPTLMPGLIESLRNNFNQQNRNISLFEIGKVFSRREKEPLPIESELIGLLMSGGLTVANRKLITRSVDFYDIKGAIEAIAESIGISELIEFRTGAIEYLQTGRTAIILLDGKQIGYTGQLQSGLAKSYKLKQEVYLAELDLALMLAASSKPASYSPLDIYPAIARDISLQIRRDQSLQSVIDTLNQNDSEFYRGAEFVDEFEGHGLPDDQKSMTIRLNYRAKDRTLTDEEVEKVHQEILVNLLENLNITQR